MDEKKTYIRFNLGADWKAWDPIWVILLFSSLLKEVSREMLISIIFLQFNSVRRDVYRHLS